MLAPFAMGPPGGVKGINRQRGEGGAGFANEPDYNAKQVKELVYFFLYVILLFIYSFRK